MGWLLYQAGMASLLVAAAPLLLLRRGGHYLPTLRRRLGGHPAVESRPRLWIHAVSVGEVMVASTLIRALPASTPLVLTTVTPTGQAVARRTLTAAGACVTYLPFDLGLPVRRFLDAYTPCALVLVEGDLWPLVLERVKRRSLPVIVVNGRISDRSYARLRRLRRWVRPLFGPVDLYGVQAELDRERLIELGVAPEKVRVTGNLKFDSPDPPSLPLLERQVRELAAGRPVLVAGSTMRGEEASVLDAFARIGGGDRALLVLAPRHPERSSEVDERLAAGKLAALRRSSLADTDSGTAAPAVLLLDTLGELASLYRLAAGAFVGGTLVPNGGHNPLEAARFAVPICAGPSMENFAEIASLLEARRAWRRVADAGELAAVWASWLDDPAAARELGERGAGLLAENRGALERTLDLLGPLLAPIAT